MEGELSRKRKHSAEAGEIQELENAAKIAAISDDDDDDDVEKLQIEEEMVVEVMKRLEEEISSSSSSNPNSAKPSVSVNGVSEESCGSSFSDSASTVMASVDTHALAGVSFFFGVNVDRAPGAEIWPWFGGWMSSGEKPEVGSTEGKEDEEEEDEWLARVLGGPLFEFDDGLFVE